MRLCKIVPSLLLHGLHIVIVACIPNRVLVFQAARRCNFQFLVLAFLRQCQCRSHQNRAWNVIQAWGVSIQVRRPGELVRPPTTPCQERVWVRSFPFLWGLLGRSPLPCQDGLAIAMKLCYTIHKATIISYKGHLAKSFLVSLRLAG